MRILTYLPLARTRTGKRGRKNAISATASAACRSEFLSTNVTAVRGSYVSTTLTATMIFKVIQGVTSALSGFAGESLIVGRLEMLTPQQERLITFTRLVIQKAQREKPWTRRVGPDTYRVTPRTANHGKYVLKISWHGEVPNVVSCIDYRTKEPCKGFTYSRQCYHSFWLLRRLVTRKEKQAA